MRKKIVSILVIILFVLTIIVKIGASKNINNVTCTTESNKQQTITEETDDVIEKLLEIKWWDWSIDEIEENIELFYQPEKMVSFFGKSKLRR